MRALILLTALALCGLAGPALSQTPGPRPEVAVIVVTLDDITQLQARYGHSIVESLGRETWGRLTYVEPPLPASTFDECQDYRSPERLDHCIRFLLDRAGAAAHQPPIVVVVLDDQPRGTPPRRGADELKVNCFGPGKAPHDPAAQTTWLWPDALRIHGVQDLQRDQDALAACIDAALSETPGEPKPGPL